MIKCAYKNILEASTVTLSAGTEDSSYPLWRIYDRDIGRIFKSTAAETIEIKVDQGPTGNLAADRLLIPSGHNLDAMALDIKHSDNDVDYRSAFSEGLAGYWRMEENSWTGAADEIKDSSGLANHGTAKNGLTTVAGGKLGRCGDFSSSSSHYIQIPHHSSLTPSDEITVGKWLYRNDTGTVNRKVMAKDGSYSLDVARSFMDKPIFYLKVDGAWRQVNGASAVPNTGWTLLIGTYNSATRKLRIYINDSAAMEVELSGLASYTIGANALADLFIGSGFGGTSTFDGKGDEAFIYSREISAAEVADIYNTGAGKIIDGRWTQQGTGLINKSWDSATHRYWKFIITSPAAIPEVPELFLTQTYEWENDPARPAGPFEEVFNVEASQTAGGHDRFLLRGGPKRQRLYHMPRCGETQKDSINTLFSDWGGSKPLWLCDHEGNWIYGRLKGPLNLKELAFQAYSFDFDFLEVLP